MGQALPALPAGGDVLEIKRRPGGTNIPIKALTSLALAAAGVFPAAAFGVSTGEFILETFIAGLAEYGVVSLAAGVGMVSGSWGGGDPEYPAGIAASYLLFGSYPLAATCGVYFVGEGAFAPSENKGAAFGITVLSAYGQTLALAGTAALVDAASDDIDEGAYTTAFIADILTKPFLVTYVYNKVKKAAPAREEGRVSFEPYVCTVGGEDGRPVPLYGVTFSF